MPTWKSYFQPSSVSEAVSVLANAGGQTKVLAGGTDLLLDIRQGRQPAPDNIVDLSSIAELCVLKNSGDHIFIGAAVTLSTIAESADVARSCQAVAEACSLIGGPQVRNMATLGGNVAHALPAADGSISLLAHDTEVEIASEAGRRRIPLGEVFLGVGCNTLSRDEIIVGFRVRRDLPGEGSAFGRIMRPQGVALPILNMAVWLRKERDQINSIHIAVGPSGEKPSRAFKAENTFINQELNHDIVERAWQEMIASLRLRTSPHRATSNYRKDLAMLLLEELVEKAWIRAQNSE